MKSRDYIFRIWDDSNKQMIPHERIECGIKNVNKKGNSYNHHLHFMQCTGISDKNDNLIFEMDILHNPDRKENCLVFYDNNRGMYMVKYLSLDVFPLSDSIGNLDYLVGNYYQNKNLIINE